MHGVNVTCYCILGSVTIPTTPTSLTTVTTEPVTIYAETTTTAIEPSQYLRIVGKVF